jgi:hypothetical protein
MQLLWNENRRGRNQKRNDGRKGSERRQSNNSNRQRHDLYLTLQEREQAYDDLHCVAAAIHETPELITESNGAVSSENKSQTSFYDLAVSIRPKLRLMFLRGERCDADLATKRCLTNWNWKLKLCA